MNQGSARPLNVRPLTQAQIEEAQRNAIVLAMCAYLLVRGAEFAFDRLAAGARFIRKGMESAANMMADNANRTETKPSQA